MLKPPKSTSEREGFLKSLHFSTDRNPKYNNIKDGYEMSERFNKSPRWKLISDEKFNYGKNDNDHSHNSVKCWKDIKKGTLVKESYSTNRKGAVNSIHFKVIPEWPEIPVDYDGKIPF